MIALASDGLSSIGSRIWFSTGRPSGGLSGVAAAIFSHDLDPWADRPGGVLDAGLTGWVRFLESR
jgi:hypothetical protein